MHEFRVYDETVDIVSAFEALATLVEDFSPQVLHFERFPKLRLEAQEAPVTPDFSVAFRDGTGVVGEIARVALHENSVEKCCRQIGRYDSLPSLPTADGSTVPVQGVAILLIVPHEVANDAVDRIIHQRALVAEHEYSPSRPPIITAWSRTSDHYTFTRNRDPKNGRCDNSSLNELLNRRFNAKNALWTDIKVEKPFCNDTPTDLYLAVLIWTKVIPSLAPGVASPTVSLADIHNFIATNYTGTVKRNSVRRAMELLQRARMVARSNPADEDFAVKRVNVPKSHPDLAAHVADSASRPKRTQSRQARRQRGSDQPSGDQLSLFSHLQSEDSDSHES